MESLMPVAFLAVIPLIALVWVLVTYNRLVSLRNQCTEAWSNIDTELKRRYELIPNLVATVKGYAAHEREVFEEITRMREACMKDAGSPAHQATTENGLVRGLNRLLARVEAYPELKASANFLDLQHELANTEDRIQAARRFYNGNVRENNNLIEMFPSSLVAGMGTFEKREFFVIESAAVRQTPSVAL